MEEVIDDFIGKFWTNDRIAEMEQLAQEHHWEFTPRARFSEQPTALKGFKLFKGKRGKRITGIMQSRQTSLSCTTRVYDYIYYSDGGKKKTTVIEMTCPELNLPAFHISPKRGLSGIFKFGRRKGSSGIEKFNKNFQLESPDPEAVEIMIPDSVLHLIADSKYLTLEGDGNILLYYHRHIQTPAQLILEEHARAMEILDRLLNDREKEFV